jgi:hypothetical protein
MLHNGQFPVALKNFLNEPHITKVGRSIENDLKHLQAEAKLSSQFPNYVELAHLAKKHQVVPNATVGLAELPALVLNHRMNKDEDIRVSNQWES